MNTLHLRHLRFIASPIIVISVMTIALIALSAVAVLRSQLSYQSADSSSIRANETSEKDFYNNLADAVAMFPPLDPPPDYTIPPIKDGLAPLLTTIPTKQPVVFLGIDDGIVKLPNALSLMRQNHIKASLYLSDTYIKDQPKYFSSFIQAGSAIEDHAVNHLQMSYLTYEDQKREICDEADIQERQFGRRPVLFRPPYGDYDQNTLRAAADCGMKAVVTWIAKANNGSMQYQIGDHLRPGDIVLMHFRAEFQKDLSAFVTAQDAAGLHTVLLESWLSKS